MPEVTAENLHGRTFGQTLSSVAKDEVHRGMRISAEDRFTSTTMAAFKDPKQVKMPVYEVSAKKATVEAKKPPPVPAEAVTRFWGVDSGNEAGDSYSKAAGKFFD